MSRKSPYRDMMEHSADPAAANAQLEEFLRAYEKSSGKPFPTAKAGTDILFRIFGNSLILSERLIANPTWADEICDAPYLTKRKGLEQITEEIASYTASIEGDLRRYKYREMIRIVAKELAGRSDEREVLLEWSDVAEAILRYGFEHAFQELSNIHGAPKSSRGENCNGSVIALGKLGSRELNMSSDIDIIFIYDTDEGCAISEDGKEISNHEFYIKLASNLSSLLSKVTPHGFLYRVDHELRPEGAQGPLANSLDGAERYYQYFGSEWERQALIRARPVAGNDLTGRGFIRAITPFVYRKTMSMHDLTHMREMKSKIENESVSLHGPYNLKLGTGGIRELEFFVQALMQLYGGAHPEVRTHNTFEGIGLLARHSFLHADNAAQLTRAYSTLRRVENLIQMDDDLQTHSLPKTEKGLLALAIKMGCSDTKDLLSTIDKSTSTVHKLFSALFEEDYERCEMETAIYENLESCKSDEERLDSLAWFKNREQKILIESDVNKKVSTPALFRMLSTIADAVIKVAWEMAYQNLSNRFGKPITKDGPSEFAIIGMGSLGSQEMDYGSDLDICFLYSGDGKTDGKTSISNVEFFTKLAQKIISLLTMMTRYGRAYSVDSELRPSGRQGALVSRLESFKEYHIKNAQIWEKIALQKTRAITGDRDFMTSVAETIFELAYLADPPDEKDLKHEIARLKERQREERSGESEKCLDLKLGDGSIADIDSIIRFYQILNSKNLKSLCVQNSFQLIKALEDESIIAPERAESLMRCLTDLRSILSNARLATGRSIDVIDGKSKQLGHIADLCGLTSSEELISRISKTRDQIKTIYNDTMTK